MAGVAGALIASGCGGDSEGGGEGGSKKRSPGPATTAAKPPAPTVAIDPQGPPLSKSQYETRFKATIKRFENSSRIDPPADASLEQQADAFDFALDRIREVAAALGKLNPPPEVRQAHLDFVNGMAAVAEDGERIVVALRDGDEEEVERLVDPAEGGSFARPATVRKIVGARVEFERKGYDLGEVSQIP